MEGNTSEGRVGVARIGHVVLRVEDLDRAVNFYRDVLSLDETERGGGRSFLTCNERHHELILVESPKRGYEQLAIEYPDEHALETVLERVGATGGERLGPITDEPSIGPAELVRAPGGHLFKLFTGMEIGATPQAPVDGVRPSRFEHISLKLRKMAPIEHFLTEGLGFRFSDRLGSMASWWHCEAEHHGVAVQRAPANHLHHHAWTFSDLNALGTVADRLHARGQTLTWGPGRHGPGNNHFIYFRDPSGALLESCSEIRRFDDVEHPYEPRRWPFRPISISLWGGVMPPSFLSAGVPAAGGR